jgi:hypothetical protein
MREHKNKGIRMTKGMRKAYQKSKRSKQHGMRNTQKYLIKKELEILEDVKEDIREDNKILELEETQTIEF